MTQIRTILDSSIGLYKDQGSKFYAYLHTIETESDCKELIKTYKKRYFEAKHHCYGMIIGNNFEIQKASDDGEPTHSAGTPILNKLKSEGLTNVVCIVVRFFGGTKLGIPGLINAYKSATEDAIRNAKIVDQDLVESVLLKCDFLSVNDVMRILKNFDVILSKQNYNDGKVEFVVSVKLNCKEAFIAAVQQNYKIELSL